MACSSEQLPVFRADDRADLVQVFLELVQDALQALLVLHATVELAEHLIGIVDRGEGLVRAGVDHACPGIGAIGHHHAEFERSVPGARLGPALQGILDLLIDRDPLGPSGGSVRATLDVAGEELDSGQQAAHAAHVVVAVTAQLVANTVQDQRAIAERLQRLQTLFELERRTFLIGPERRGHDAVGAEHHDQPLLAPLLIRKSQARQIQDERHGRCADSQVADELASIASVGHDSCSGVLSSESAGRSGGWIIDRGWLVEGEALDPREHGRGSVHA